MGLLLTNYEINRGEILEKKLSQIMSMAGDSEILHEETYNELREYYSIISSDILIKYMNECLDNYDTKTEKYGYALQELLNEVARRLGYKVTNGLLKGVRGKIGHDGLWVDEDGHSIILESKKTAAYQIKLKTLEDYREKLIESGEISRDKSSILIIVGRESQDFIDQVSGSRISDYTRIITVNSFIKLLSYRENNASSIVDYQIKEMLKPLELMQLDSLIDLVLYNDTNISDEKSTLENSDEEIEVSIKTRKKRRNGDDVSVAKYVFDKLQKLSELNFEFTKTQWNNLFDYNWCRKNLGNSKYFILETREFDKNILYTDIKKKDGTVSKQLRYTPIPLKFKNGVIYVTSQLYPIGSSNYCRHKERFDEWYETLLK